MAVEVTDEDCKVLEFGCKIGEGISDWANGQVFDFAKSMAEGTVQVLTALTTFWLEIPSPDVLSPVINTLNANLAWYTFVLALIGIFIAVGRMVLSNQFSSGMSGVKMLINLILVTGVYSTVVASLITASDAFAPWIIEKATGGPLSLSGLLSVNLLIAGGIGPAFLLSLTGFIGSVINVLFMLVRIVMVSLLMAFLPALAAASGSETGNQAFKKAQGYLLAFILFKPIAGVIYALGFLFITDPPNVNVDEVGEALYMTSIGTVTLVLAGLTLPALIKFIVPVAANGTSSAFSGASVAAAGVAVGAAVVTLGSGVAAGAGSRAATRAGKGAASGGKAATGAAQTASSGAGGSSGSSASGAAPAASSSGSGSRGGASTAPGSRSGSSSGGGSGSGASGASSSAPGSGSPSGGGAGPQSGGGSASPAPSGSSQSSTQSGYTGTSNSRPGRPQTSGAVQGSGGTPSTAGRPVGGTNSATAKQQRRQNTARGLSDLSTAAGAGNQAIDDAAKEE
jgi:type IV secretion system protein TrbL